MAIKNQLPEVLVQKLWRLDKENKGGGQLSKCLYVCLYSYFVCNVCLFVFICSFSFYLCLLPSR